MCSPVIVEIDGTETVGTGLPGPDNHPRCCRLLRLELVVLDALVHIREFLALFGHVFEFGRLFEFDFIQVVVLGLALGRPPVEPAGQ